ncbi:MAG: cobyrinate a,c-diamide synthase [Aestuariivita sp.]|nr:cobyrinate a,c-diamide synthase [Aestuariivita sp.]MCY4346543.1 cobyrinate a,c-diamide synthase [Aestuariivita sp.]
MKQTTINAPGILISAPASGTGKTTVTLGLLRSFRDRGLVVQPFKSGPDYIDPAFHQAAAGRPSFNLDTWAMAPNLTATLAAEAKGADLCIAEGSMGLYDGVATLGQSGYGSSAETAKQMGWSVILVVDASGQAQSAAATALGFQHYDQELHFAGVILNRIASSRHERLIRQGFERAGVTVFGVLPRRGDLVLPERHLGLVQAIEHPDLQAAITQYASFLSEHVDLEKIHSSALEKPVPEPDCSNFLRPPAQRIALATDAAFSFTYPHLLKGWREAGAEILPFSPLADDAPSLDADLVWLPGGYPELYAGVLASAKTYFSQLRKHAETKPVHGECGGYMTLGEALIDKDGVSHSMAGLLGLVTSHKERKLHLGYRRAELTSSMLGYLADTTLRGHEFHYSTIIEQPDQPFARVTDADGNPVREAGSRRGHTTGTFFHLMAEENA